MINALYKAKKFSVPLMTTNPVWKSNFGLHGITMFSCLRWR